MEPGRAVTRCEQHGEQDRGSGRCVADDSLRRYGELRGDPVQWAGYLAELALTDAAAGDGLPSAREEYPEYNA